MATGSWPCARAPIAVALVSTDGVRWTPLDLSGDMPSAGSTTQAILLPSGVLVSDGTATWFGHALSR